MTASATPTLTRPALRPSPTRVMTISTTRCSTSMVTALPGDRMCRCLSAATEGGAQLLLMGRCRGY